MKLLDLFCGEGLAAWGYWLSGRFSEIVGIDTNPDMRDRYSFDFLNMSAQGLTYDFLDQFDFIHASPTCQGYSYITPDQNKHIRLVAATKLMLYASGKPHVIENVQGAVKDLRPNLEMDGHYFGLQMERRRFFYVSTLAAPQRLIKQGQSVVIHGGDYVRRADLIRAFGLEVINENITRRLTRTGIEQGVPPAKLSGTIQNDILKEYIARGTYIYPPRPAMRIITDLFAWAGKEMPDWNTISISGYHIREAGSTAVQEVAFTLANAIAYIQAALDAGLSIDSFAPRLSFFFNSHNDLLEEVAKFRAARRLYAKLMKERFGARDPKSMMLRFHAQTAGSTLTARRLGRDSNQSHPRCATR